MIVALLTDYGTQDHYVAALKAALLARAPHVHPVDITHEVPAQAVASGAFLLWACYREFPPGTIVVGVVDPGVGTARRGLVAQAGPYWCVGPDNGLFSHVLGQEEPVRAWALTEARHWRHPVSTTFHGRDIFAPVAAALARGIGPEEFGPPVDDWVRLPPLGGRPMPGGVQGEVVHVDRFGNCITSLRPEALEGAAEVTIGGRPVRRRVRTYAEIPPGEVALLVGSTGLVEAACRNASAADALAVGVGVEVQVRRGPSGVRAAAPD